MPPAYFSCVNFASGGSSGPRRREPARRMGHSGWEMLRVRLVKGKYEVEALDEAGHRFLSAYARAHLIFRNEGACLAIDPRFLGTLLDAATEAKLIIEGP
jgi:hypothetical protein